MRSGSEPGAATRRRIASLLALGVAGCAPEQRDFEIRDVRSRLAPEERLGATSDERFGASARMDVHGSGAPFAFELPPGWRSVAPAPMRDVDLRTDRGAEVWISVLGGDGGGALANLDRWRLQLGLAPVDGAAVDALPRVPLLDGSAYRVDLRSQDGSRRLLGLMLFRARGAVFVRISGSPAAVDAELPAFAAFCGSLRDLAAPAESERDVADTPFGWTAPAAWFALPPGRFGLCRFRVTADVEVAVAELAGDGGGLAANVTRWAEQVGLPAPALDALPRVDVLGRPAVLVELLADGGRGIVGVVCPLDDSSVFATLTGPADRVRAHEAAFRAFVASFRERG